jgi:hypothetical protein
VSETYSECPLYNHANCREYYNPKLCAIVRKDKTCLRKRKGVGKGDRKGKNE